MAEGELGAFWLSTWRYAFWDDSLDLGSMMTVRPSGFRSDQWSCTRLGIIHSLGSIGILRTDVAAWSLIASLVIASKA